MRAILYLALFLAMLFVPVVQAIDVVRYHISKKNADAKQSYYIDMLHLALEKSKDIHGEYEFTPVVYEMPQGRTSIMVQLDQGIDVTWRVTSQELEERLQAVYVPLLKGMMGHRIFIINQSDQSRFSPDMSLEQLRKMSAGQGYDWPDSIVLQHNGINVVEGGTDKLLTMLARRRFDYFPRAIHEPWTEIIDKPEFIVEKHILLRYPAPFYFFVNKDNTKLYHRINNGLEIAIEDGSFDQLFENHPITKEVLKAAAISERKVFQLTNPILSERSQALLKEPRYWLNLSSQ
ncbi:hypothetical protein LP316_05280 [Thalassotalea sp. LPB0316]|uniref:hypothetical protein n=1 Tax=Thalassotalea sp. LPB0316 TaxID=2769490 RepID=UPI001867A322|nr:hypothetical protein [Thalassotalea sp. LPB0316]QOL26713.1 hypothetical protein LP316_05280 [Thalassotalea sp. LPB0316]